MRRHQIKRETDLQIISNWIEPESKVLDLGCGRGLLLQHLRRQKNIYGVGVDVDIVKVQSCVKREINVYQGDAVDFLHRTPDQFYDWVILSRMVQELVQPGQVIREALRAGRKLAVGFVNHGFWRNRMAQLFTGNRIINEVFPLGWDQSHPSNPVTIHGFESFCQQENIRIARKIYLGADWKSRCRYGPNLMAGYAVYHLEKKRGNR
jgi:methionine biosynthesis protein MetW